VGDPLHPVQAGRRAIVTPARSPRVLIVVCDSLGIGDAPDAGAYGDEGSNTLANTARTVGGIDAPNLVALGLGALGDVAGMPTDAAPGTAHGRLTERSAGKDTITGHWELAGIVLEQPFPLYPNGFPPEIIEPFERAIGRRALGNVAASGTEIIERLGGEHVRTGDPIVYTSGDSVFQIAAHLDVVSIATLYQWCRVARRLLDGPHRVGRVIARPFAGVPGRFVRTPARRDFSVPPPAPTLLDRARDAGVGIYGVGKIQDIFAGRGLTEGQYSSSNDDGVDRTLRFLRRPEPVLVMTNLVDFDSKYGHRNDPEGYARCIESLDGRIPELISALDGGVMFITGDHGCDPTTPSTDHSRERTPVLVAGLPDRPAIDVGTRTSFADLGATAGELLSVDVAELAGRSFADDLIVDEASSPEGG
jgi:phosphopentomutase